MRRSIQNMVLEVRLYWKNYVFQSFFATVAIFFVLLFLTLQHAVIVASIGASAFIVFAMPNSITAKPRNVIGGHIVGVLSGVLFGLIPHSLFLHPLVVYPLSVGLSIFIMVVTDTEHSPASGTALGIAMTGVSLNVVTAILTSPEFHF